ncbi:MAG: DMT family transporter [Cyanobacteria bacterium SID2]|nr:DMT family transporter [Cyanobacteria bacterium SID2]MBP0006535.1 DMT family transporter [Cyanobacteria bacterium SBC]
MTKPLEVRHKSIIPWPAELLSVLTLSIALVAVSCAAIFIRIAERDIGPNATIFSRLVIATVVFWGLDALRQHRSNDSGDFALTPPNTPYTANDIVRLVSVALVSTLSVTLWAWSLTQTSVANSTLLRNLTPIFTSLGGWLLLGQHFDRRFILGTAIAVSGAAFISFDDFNLAAEHLLGDGLALLSAVLYGANLLLVEGLRSKYPATTILLWRCSVGAALIFPVAWFSEDRILPQTWEAWFAVIALAVVCQALGQGLLVHSLKTLSSGFVAVLLLLEPLLTAIFAWVIFSEALDFDNWVAFFVVLVGIYFARSSRSSSGEGVRR